MITKKKRVVITGLGPVSPVGTGVEEFWDSLVRGRSGITELTRFDASAYPSRIAGEVKGFDPEDFMTQKTAASSARFTQLALAAARLAFEDAGIDIRKVDPERIGACLGSTTLGTGDILEKQIPLFYEKGLKKVHPLTCVEFTTHIATSYVPIELGIKGCNTSISSGCSTAIDAVNWSCTQIVEGNADLVVTGAADAPLFPFGFATFCAVRVLSRRNDDPPGASRPYEKDRDGLVLSEAGAAVVLEELEHARRREATIYGEVLGFASVSEAKKTVAVEMSGATVGRVIETALINAGLPSERIDYINAHGNSMVDYDISETRGFKRALGEHAYRIPISSIKSMMGQSLAPASGLQVISSCLTLRDDLIPPTINYHRRDPDCDLDYVPNRVRRNRVDTVLINSHSVGGSHSAIIIGRYKGEGMR